MKHRDAQEKKGPNQRQLRVAERIRHILAQVMQRGEMHDPILEQSSLITVTSVEIGPDLKHANAYVMPLGGKNADEIVKALNRASGFFRTALSRELDLRYAPKVSFRIDGSFANAAHIDSILRRDDVRRDLEKPDAPEDDEQDDNEKDFDDEEFDDQEDGDDNA